MRAPVLFLLTTAAMLSTAGCQRTADAATEAALERASGHEVAIDRDGKRARILTPDGEINLATGGGMPLPDDFPADLFLPPTYAVNSVMEVGDARLVNMESEGTVAAMFDAARSAMQRRGWSQTLAMQQADSGMLGFSRDGREATYTFTGHGEGQLAIGIQLRAPSGRH